MNEDKQLQFEEVKGSFWKPEKEGEFIIGKYIDKKEEQGKFKTNIYYFETEEGAIGVWSSTVIDSQMLLMNIGDTLKIIYKGIIDKGDRQYKDYSILRAKNE